MKSQWDFGTVIGLIAGLETLDDEILTLSNLQAISRLGSGVSNIDLKSLNIFFLRLFFFVKSNNLSSSSESLQLIFKNEVIILTIFFPSVKDLGSLIFLSNLFKISDIDLPAIILS